MSLCKNICHSENSCFEFPMKGVKLSVFQDLIEANQDKMFECHVDSHISSEKGKKSFKEMTTYDVCKQIIIPLLADDAISYCEYLEKWDIFTCCTGMSSVGTANVYIIHAWEYKFVNVVHTLTQYLQDDSSTFIWFDLFSMNQIISPNLKSQDWIKRLEHAIKDVGHVVLISSLWKNFIPLSRVWCIYEIYCAVNAQCRFEMAFDSAEKQQIWEEFGQKNNTLLQAIGNIDIGKARCLDNSYKGQIFEIMNRLPEQEVTINKVVSGRLHLSIFEMLTNMMNDMENLQEEFRMIRKLHLADVFRNTSLNSESIVTSQNLYVDILQYFEKKGGDYLGRIYSGIGSAYLLEGNLVVSLDYLERAYKIFTSTSSSCDHEELCDICNSIGLVHMVSKSYDLALTHFTEAVTLLESVSSGIRNKKLISVYRNISEVYVHKKCVNKANENYRKCSAAAIATYYPEHPFVARCHRQMGDIFAEEAEYLQALDYYQKAVDVFFSGLGSDNYYLISIYQQMGLLYGKLERYDSASEYYKRSLKIFAKLGIDDNIIIGEILFKLGLTYKHQKEYDEALMYFSRSLKLNEALYGVDSSDITANIHDNIGWVYLALKNEELAIKHCEKCLSIRMNLYNSNHIAVGSSYRNMGKIYEVLKKYEEAYKKYEKAFVICSKSLNPDNQKLKALKECLERCGKERTTTYISYI